MIYIGNFIRKRRQMESKQRKGNDKSIIVYEKGRAYKQSGSTEENMSFEIDFITISSCTYSSCILSINVKL